MIILLYKNRAFKYKINVRNNNFLKKSENDHFIIMIKSD
jgi:hypothetical protein